MKDNSSTSPEERRDGPLQPHLGGPTIPHSPARRQFKKYRLQGQMISCSNGSNCYNVEGRVAIVKNIVELTSGAIQGVCVSFTRVRLASPSIPLIQPQWVSTWWWCLWLSA